MNISKLGVAKYIVSGIVGLGTGKIVGQAIKTHVTAETLIDKITIAASAWVIGAMATQATKKYTSEMIDGIAEAVVEVFDKTKTTAKLAKISNNESTFEAEELDPENFVFDAETSKWKPKKKTLDEEARAVAMKKIKQIAEEAGLGSATVKPDGNGGYDIVEKSDNLNV